MSLVAKDVEERERVIVRFAGDSGDGMQLVGGRFTDATATLGNDLATLPNFPAEIRAPAGTLAGVSSFQIHFAAHDILTPGDTPNVLVAMNPAALKANIGELARGGTIIANEDAFTARNLQKAGYERNPLDDGSLAGFVVQRVPMNTLSQRAVEGMAGRLGTRRAARQEPVRARARVLAVRAPDRGHRELDREAVRQPADRARCEPRGVPRRLGVRRDDRADRRPDPRAGGDATSPPAPTARSTGRRRPRSGLIAASVRSGLQLVFASYPITPASELLHELARRREAGVRTIQAEDEIAAAGMALGAAFGGALGVTATSGPGMDLKAETIGLAVMLELPMVIIDVQRAGPSTGMPTKTEQSDLLMALYGRHGESPLPVVCASTPAQCFDAALEAVRIAVRYRTPVILLSDLFLANSSEPWRIPEVDSLPAIDPAFAPAANGGEPFEAYARNADGARPWAVPGTPGLAHRIGGIEKSQPDGGISYEPPNHQLMTDRAARADRRDRGPAARARRRSPMPSCWCSAGVRATARCAQPCAGCARPGGRLRTPSSTTSTRSRPTPASCSRASRACSWRR